jgi:hypothetical protein
VAAVDVTLWVIDRGSMREEYEQRAALYGSTISWAPSHLAIFLEDFLNNG